MPPPLELTLVLAATRDMGIGLNGTLPWTGLKKEMAYFARVTKRISSSPTLPSSSDATSPPNAVIMGRKTWESIPPRFRPLKGRLNIVVSRSAHSAATVSNCGESGVVMAPSLEQALSYLRTGEKEERRVFVIGGGQIYAAALKLKETKRILLTRVLSDFECDTFFPLALQQHGEGGGGGVGDGSWKRSPKDKFDEWVGEQVPEGVQEENGTRYEFQMWERV
ncbi:dihydrofolate reductase-like domain-containing protein [Apodospora peruviana]|uniref:Dihydrofolate reductase n=1 Tax=Apodospora peruviana TaxID=516989 RepID=A0AAE0ICD0_9PEZI|nr:dihydrofolate reductase-like domain-containing protein [Apodospora peruviana]